LEEALKTYSLAEEEIGVRDQMVATCKTSSGVWRPELHDWQQRVMMISEYCQRTTGLHSLAAGENAEEERSWVTMM
jgi:hypothetical protein